MATNHHRAVRDPPAVDGIGMVADVNEIAAGQMPPQLSRKKKELVELAQPFRDEVSGKQDSPENRLRLNELDLNTFAR